MGVPKFYRWISERYPCLSEIVKEHQISEFDNLYLDMNGIIHVVSHPDDSNPHFRITEEKIFRDVFHYIDVLFRLIKPRKVFFMAIDGVAPRAKMNQQRGRRFRSAREAEELIAKAISKGETLPSEDRFDSNCITPGTPFMVRLQEQLKYFVTDRITNNALWQGPRVYLSGHETPGEGEHKIMDFIRSERSNPNHDPNTRHCLYGLDADLMMLGLTSHEPHFSLLREEVRFGGKESQKRSTTPEDTTFHLLHLSLMREYIDHEFSRLKDKLPFPYDLERIIDDWVLMGFLVGNDFIPHLPNLHIDKEGLPLLWGVYMKVLPEMDGYINEDGKINLRRLEKYMAVFAKSDFENFSDTYADLKWFAGKTGGKGIGTKKKGSPERQKFNKRKAEELYKKANKFELPTEIDDPEDLMFDDVSDSDNEEEEERPMTDAEALLANGAVSEKSQETLMIEEFNHHKRGYYMEKLGVGYVTEEFLRDQALQYVRALQWILYYYYDGCPSWSWFYPFHYAPYISDIHSFANVEIKFELCKPFLPFQQLMAVLPSASKKLLPQAYWTLMTEDTSPIFDFYPQKFETDLNGKRQEWEAVVLIPFIDEKRLLAAMGSRESQLTKEEKSRNIHGPCRLYQHSIIPQPPFPSSLPGAFPDININHAKCTELDQWEFVIPRAMLKRGLFEGVLLDVHFPGFPTFKHLPHKTSLKKANVKVFQANSRGDNMIVRPDQPKNDLILNDVASELLGKTVFVRWPHLVEARVEAVCDGCQKISIVRPKEGTKETNVELQWSRKNLDNYEQGAFFQDRDSLSELSFSRRGIDLVKVDILVYVQALQGRRYICSHHGKITLDKQYGRQQEYHAYQTVVTDLQSHCPGFEQFSTLKELYCEGCEVFMIGKHAYGSQGKVLDTEDEGRIRVKFRIKQEPDLTDIQYKKDSLSLKYMPSWMVAQKLSLSSHLVSKITGTYRIPNGQGDQSVNIGLNLKSNVKEEEVPGYTTKSKGQWLYSNKVVQILNQYMTTWPRIFEIMDSKSESDIDVDELFPEGCGKNINDLTKFVKTLECYNVPRVTHGCQFIDEPVIRLLEKELDIVNEDNKKSKKYQTIQVRPHLLYRPIIGNDVVADATTEYQLFDRVVNVRIGFSVPLGLRGTIIGIYPSERDTDTMYEVLFDEEFVDALKIRCSTPRAYRMNGIALINISHGERKHAGPSSQQSKNKNTPANRKPYQNGNAYDGGRRKNDNDIKDVWNDMKRTNSPRKSERERQDMSSSPRRYERERQDFSNSSRRSERERQDISYAKCVKTEKSSSSNGVVDDDESIKDSNKGNTMMVIKKKSAGKKLSRQLTPENYYKAEDSEVSSLNEAASALINVPKPAEGIPKQAVIDPEFAALMENLSMSQSAAEEAKTDSSKDHAPAQPVYGKKVSVEELFQVAQNDHSKKIDQPVQKSPNSAVKDLEAWSQSRGLPPPRYEYDRDKSNQIRASVILGNQLRFQSSLVKTEDQAAQSAAAIALRELKHVGTGPRPTSAFRPVQPAPAQARNHPVTAVHPQGAAWQQPAGRPEMMDPRTLSGQPVIANLMQQRGQNPRHMAYAMQMQQQQQQQLRVRFQQQQQIALMHHLMQQQQMRGAHGAPQMFQGAPMRYGPGVAHPHLGMRPAGNFANDSSIVGFQHQHQQQQQRVSVADQVKANQVHPPSSTVGSSSVSPRGAPTSAHASSTPHAQGSTLEEPTSRKRTDSTSSNPFVPLQVTRHRKTPQMKSSSEERDESSHHPSTTDTSPPAPAKTDTKTKSPAGKPKKKKSASRMAAQFPPS